MRIVIFSLFFIILSGFPFYASAQQVGASCSAEFWEVLKQRSWLEGNREMEAAQAILLKPDSILDYSCFDQRVLDLAAAADDLFSDNVDSPVLFRCASFTPNDKYQPTFVCDPGPDPPGGPYDETSLDFALNDSVLDPYYTYANWNYKHKLGGGLSNISPGGTCENMNRIWEFLRCYNFNGRDDADMFADLTWGEIAGKDTRNLAVECQNPAARTAEWQQALQRAFPPMEPQNTYVSELKAGACGKPVLTGVTTRIIQEGVDETFFDAVCVAPGCYYDGAGACRP